MVLQVKFIFIQKSWIPHWIKSKKRLRCAIDLDGHLSHPPLEHLSALVGKKNTPECLGG